MPEISRLVLASSSKARRQVLKKLEIPFEAVSPCIDESALHNESPQSLVERLARAKAQKVASKYPRQLIIGSDQVAVVNRRIVGKPSSRDDAIQQLLAASGQSITLYTSLALLNAETGHCQSDILPYTVRFRNLSKTMIEDYVDRDKPYDCGGSLRSEGLGISLLQEFSGSDPNILLGLPLIRLVDMLANEGVHPLAQ